MKNFEDLVLAREIEKADFGFSKPSDVFIYTRFLAKNSCNIKSEKIYFADNISEAIAFIRHIFLYDILNDLSDDLEYEFDKSFSEKQSDIISIMSFWYRIGKLLSINRVELLKFCNEFNSKFQNRNDTEYEIKILYGADELRKFLIKRYRSNADFNKYELECICSEDLYAPMRIKEFLNKLFKD